MELQKTEFFRLQILAKCVLLRISNVDIDSKRRRTVCVEKGEVDGYVLVINCICRTKLNHQLVDILRVVKLFGGLASVV